MMDTEFTDEDMAAVGRALMRAIATHADKGWSPAECPSEIVGDMRNERDAAIAMLDALTGMREDAERYRILRDEDAWGEDTATGGGSAWGELGELHAADFDAFVDARFHMNLTSINKPVSTTYSG